MKTFVYLLWFFFLLTAVNSANNLFYLVFSLFTSFIFAPGFMASRSFAGLSFSRQLPARVFAGETVPVPAVISNDSKNEKFLLKIIDGSPSSLAVEKKIFALAAGVKVEIPLQYKFMNRGVNLVPSIKVGSELPFLLSERSALLDSEGVVIAYPKIAKVLLKTDTARDSARKYRKSFNTSSNEFDKFKQYSTGDQIHKINWRHYSITRTLIIPKFEELNYGDFAVVMILAEPDAPGSRRYELAVSAAASVSSALSASGRQFKFVSASSNIRSFELINVGIDKILTHTAMVNGSYRMTAAALRKIFYETTMSPNVILVSSSRFEGFEKLLSLIGARVRCAIVAAEKNDGPEAPAIIRPPGKFSVYEINALEALEKAAL